MMTTDTLILGDFNAQHSSWYSSSTDSRGTMLESMVSCSKFGILNWDSPTRLPGNANPSSPDVSLSAASLITSTNWQTKTNLGSDHLPILISLQMDVTINPIQHRTSNNLKKANWDRYSREIEYKLSKRLPTNCQKGEKILRVIILKAASHHIPSGRHRLNTEQVPTEILEKMRARDDLRSRDSTSPALPEMNDEITDEITRITNKNGDSLWRRWITRQILQNSCLHVVEPPRRRSLIWQIGVVVVYPLPWPLLVGGVRCSRLWSTSQLLRPSGQQCSHSGGVCPQIQGRQCGAYVGAVEEMMCVVCVDVTEGA